MGVVPKRDTPEARAFWDHAEKMSKQVESWPAWKRSQFGDCVECEYPPHKPSVIFLDWDGVLNDFSQTMTPGSFKQGIKPECIEHLNWLLEQSGARIVFSSSWRMLAPDIAEWEKELHRLGATHARIIGSTPVLNIQERGEEVSAWLKENPDVESYVILDDCDNLRPHLFRLVQTKMHIGLTREDAERALKMLQRPLREVERARLR